MVQDWGGTWTDRKLSTIRDYLISFQSALKNLSYFRKVYIDALAGEGVQTINQEESLLNFEEGREAKRIRLGSAVVASQIKPAFDWHYLNEKSVRKAERLRKTFASVNGQVTVSSDDANEFVKRTINSLKQKDRGVILLDPWGLQIEWGTIKLIAESQKLDMWYLFPTQGVVRMLPNDGMPPLQWANKLDALLGDRSWRDAFYQPVVSDDLFGNRPTEYDRSVSFDAVENYVSGRLQKLFYRGSWCDAPLRIGPAGKPLFSFYFASGNPSAPAKRLTKTLATAVIKANAKQR